MIRGCVACAALAIAAVPLRAQIAPAARWQSISTEHFRVHFTPPLEALARRAAGEAERAWTRLSAELAPPRTPVDVVVADTRDVANGQAQYFPTNRIVVWARPPIDNPALRFSDDWLQQVVTHELAHVFHLDRTRGLWRVGQAVFGRHPALFPNARSPRWLTEGIAVAYESRLSGGGRLNGSELPATMHAWTAEHGAPVPGALSFATPHWPGGELAYFAGAQLVDGAEHRGGDSALRRFIDRVAVYPVPYLWDIQARAAFGASFGTIARTLADTAVAEADRVEPIAGPYWELRSPRWHGDDLYFVASGPRELTGLYRTQGSNVRRIARRNSVEAFGVAGDRLVHSELEFVDAYHLVSVLHVDGRARRGAGRVSSPDVRGDGTIVAVETASGAARLVVFDADGNRVRDLTAADPDVQWSAPRWSRAGDRIAAMRWRRGGDAELVLLSETGSESAAFARARAVQGSPSWDVGDRAVYFVSDRTGRGAVYRVAVAGPDSAVVRLVAGGAALSDAEVSPDGTRIAAVRVTPVGHELITLAANAASDAPRAGPPVFTAGLGDDVVSADGEARRYSPFRTLVPRYWIPTAGTSARNEISAGFFTSGTDVIGRHNVTIEALWDVTTGEPYGTGTWSYRGFGMPIVDMALNQSWTVFPIADSAGVRLGEVTRRSRTVALTATLSRPRVRRALSLTAGAEYEWRHFETHPSALADLLENPPPDRLRYPSVLLAAGWSATRRAAFALGAEDGLSLSVTARRRWRTDDPSGTAATTVIGRSRVYASLPLPGYARHVLALAATGGWAEPQTSTLFSGGGVSGTSLEVLPGYRIGDSQRSFFVRGFSPGTVSGIRAWGGSAEYRAPLARIGRGLWPLPFYFQRSSLALFGDAASAWCPETEPTGACPNGRTPARTIGSVGAELQLDATIEYDTPNRFRVGVATPVRGHSSATWYFSLGLPF